MTKERPSPPCFPVETEVAEASAAMVLNWKENVVWKEAGVLVRGSKRRSGEE
ncbi:hypothetical protein CCACVL1_00123 [Corchorus capsularis]|uniref:Uncharacterized protein n=1 Tax=Corchorus capsularis TaxID=210143 RepID=A0A1R3KYF4_COCAP|nr:hypothetical protein CCACVL1_00123 [Corchorus capsularis]